MKSRYFMLKEAVVVAALVLAFASQGIAKPVSRPLSFQTWKRRQILAAENDVVRLSNQLHILTSGYYRLLDSQSAQLSQKAHQGSSGVAASDGQFDRRTKLKKSKDRLSQIQAQLDAAADSLEFCHDLDFDQYLAVYVSQFRDNPEKLKEMAKRLSKSELQRLVTLALTTLQTASPPLDSSALSGAPAASLTPRSSASQSLPLRMATSGN